jgi:hypothetical protein
MKKVFIFLLAVLLVIGGGVWYFVSFRMDSMIEQQIERVGTTSFGSRVSVGSVHTSIKDGSLTISNISVANPPGYRNKEAFSLNGIEAAVDYENLDIKRVVIDNPEIIIEELNGETNFSQMLAELEQQGSEPAAEGSGNKEPIIVIHHFRMNESRAAFESEALDRYSTIEIDAVELKNIRGTPSEVAAAIANEVIEEIVSEAAKEMLKAKASEKMDDIFGSDKN